MIHDLICAVASLFGLTAADLTGDSRLRHIVLARHAAAWLLRTACPALSLESIGQHLGGRDHTTIIHAIRRCDARMAADPRLSAELYALLSAARLADQVARSSPRKRRGPNDPAFWGVQFVRSA